MVTDDQLAEWREMARENRCPPRRRQDTSVKFRAQGGFVITQLLDEVERQRQALAKIDEIRNSIIGHQAVNWSAHIYPLVAALDEAGFGGKGYDAAHDEALTQLDRIEKLEAELAEAKDLALELQAALGET